MPEGLELLCESAGGVKYLVQNDSDSLFVVSDANSDTNETASNALIRLAGSTVDDQQIAASAVEESKADIEKKLVILVIKWSK